MFGRSHGLHGASDGLGLEVLYSPAGSMSDRDAVMDIVFVHGLGGSRIMTWSKDTVLWPRSLLAKDFPRARVLTWGYDADVIHFFGPVGQSNVQDHAKVLNRDLQEKRFEDHQRHRPIIFVAHSLGGLIVKDALFLSYREHVKGAREGVDKRLAAIKPSTKGVLFTGTPHRGADKATWAVTAANLAWYLKKDSSREVISILKRGSEVLERLQDQFKDILEDFSIYTFIEEVGYPKIGRIVEKDSAVIGWHEKIDYMHANHCDMIKFASETENNYKKIRLAIREIVMDHIGVRPEANVSSYPSDGSNIPQWLSNVPSSDFQYNQRSRQQGLLIASDKSVPDKIIDRCAQPDEQHVNKGQCVEGCLAASNEAENYCSEYVIKHMKQGKRFLKEKSRNVEQNLVTARKHFGLAEGALLQANNRNPESFTQLYYQFMIVEMEMSYNREISIKNKMSHLQNADVYGDKAVSWARSGGSRGNIAEVMLQQAVLKGRRAEVDARLGMNPQEVRKQKDEAISEITKALQELQCCERSNLGKITKWAKNYRDRFQPADVQPEVI